MIGTAAAVVSLTVYARAIRSTMSDMISSMARDVCNQQPLCNGRPVEWLTLGMLFLTGLFLIWYTIETYRLRREAQLQIELQNRPFLSLLAQRIEPSVIITNIGKGLARNIEISDVLVGSTFVIGAPPMTHLASGDTEVPEWRVKVSLDATPPTETPYSDPAAVAARILTSQPAVILVLTYASIVGQRYRTALKVEQGTAHIVEDGRL